MAARPDASCRTLMMVGTGILFNQASSTTWKEKVQQALIWLREHNRYYKDVRINTPFFEVRTAGARRGASSECCCGIFNVWLCRVCHNVK